ncbi:hypothetical protein COLO4_06385 [Corchorus olitorius]|uniref:TF-B3 domain-containing protein n=1 Tax=Corchorus olitorius TaxID=93759 RepID=A0A1R3KN67_9ROSI|nr:hypothetical protein COLO4_06385 [Corchorus olitorius]
MGILVSIQKAAAINMKELQQWEKPEVNWCKANCDAAFCKETGYAGIGVVIRNSDAEVVGGLAERYKVCSSLIAEGIAVRNGLKVAKQMRIHKIVVEIDSQVLAQSVERSGDTHWEIDNIAHDIRALMKDFEDCRFRWIARSANKAADWLSQQSKKGMCISNWRIPRKFVRKHGRELSGAVQLTVPDWDVTLGVEVAKSDNGEVWLGKGWQQFCEHYDLKTGYFLVFDYQEDGSFQVLPFDLSRAAETEYPYISDSEEAIAKPEEINVSAEILKVKEEPKDSNSFNIGILNQSPPDHGKTSTSDESKFMHAISISISTCDF